MASQVIYWTTDMSLWCPASSFHISHPMEPSTPFPGGSNNSKQSSVQSGSRLFVDSSSTPKHLALILFDTTSGYHHCMLAPCCILSLWNEFICRDFYDWFLVKEAVWVNNRPVQEVRIIQALLCLIMRLLFYFLNWSIHQVSAIKSLIKHRGLGSHCLGFRVERKATHHHSFQVCLTMNLSKLLFSLL